jgi:hypothetical protein
LLDERKNPRLAMKTPRFALLAFAAAVTFAAAADRTTLIVGAETVSGPAVANGVWLCVLGQPMKFPAAARPGTPSKIPPRRRTS